jgi:hypothetical protein
VDDQAVFEVHLLQDVPHHSNVLLFVDAEDV